MLASTIARSSTAALPLPLRSSQKYNGERYRGVDTARVKPAMDFAPKEVDRRPELLTRRATLVA
jgi:hypothetical protein